MSEADDRPVRRLRLSRPDEAPRVEDLDALLRDVDHLRLTLETDLTLAASALEAGAPDMAVEILDSDQRALALFEHRALTSLDNLDALEQEPARRGWRAQVVTHAAPILVAAAVVSLLSVVGAQIGGQHDTPIATQVAATSSLERLQQLARAGDITEVRAASAELHQQLAGLVADASTDPGAAQTALQLLSAEQTAITQSADRSALTDVLRQSLALATAIRAALPASVRAATPGPYAVNVEPPQASAAPPAPSSAPTDKASPSASPKASPRPSASPKSSPHSSASPSPSPSPSGNPYPTIPPAPHLQP